jgi:hypothetical protein
MASVHAVRAKMEKKAAVKKEMIDYVGHWQKDNERAELFGGAMAMAIDGLVDATKAGKPIKVYLPTLVKSEVVWATGIVNIMGRLRQEGDDEELTKLIITLMRDEKSAYVLGCVLGSFGRTCDTDAMQTTINNHGALGILSHTDAIFHTSVVMVMADCARIINKSA